MTHLAGKGSRLEEDVRHYFSRNSYFVIRGAKLKYEGYDVTDVDCFLYSKSGLSRNTAVVDIKGKKSPQAMERILWASGLKIAIRADFAKIVTTDGKTEVHDFGRRMGVDVINSRDISKWVDNNFNREQYIFEEDLITRIKSYKYYKHDGNWLEKYEILKTSLVTELGYGSAIESLSIGQFFLDKYIESNGLDDLPLRLFYRSIAYFCLSLDYEIYRVLAKSKEISSSDILDGLVYGANGKAGVDNTLDTLKVILNDFADNGRQIFNLVKGRIDQSLGQNRKIIISEFVSKSSVYPQLFRLAQILDNHCLRSNAAAYIDTAELRSLIYALLDFWEVDRAKAAMLIPLRDPAQYGAVKDQTEIEKHARNAQSENNSEG